jgi:hypothetical protein
MSLKKIFLSSKKFSVKHVNFFSIYEKEFAEFKNKKINFLEIGVLHGGSLEMWKNFFLKAKIYGADINHRSLGAKGREGRIDKDNFKIFIGDQRSKIFWSKIKKKIGEIDILIDDGGHTNEQNINTIINALPLMSNKSKIIIEDTHCSYMSSFGNPHKYSTINFCKTIIDSINLESELLYNSQNKNRISNINFYSGLVVIDIDRDLASKEKKIIFNNGKKFIENILSNKYENNFFLNCFYNIYNKFYSIIFFRNIFESIIFLINFLMNFKLIKKFKFFLKK